MKKIMFQDKYGLTKAVLDGSKTVTRRVIKCPNRIAGVDVYNFQIARNNKGEVTEVCCIDHDERCIDGGELLPKYKVGEIVAVAQSYEVIDNEFPHAMIYSKLYDALELDKSNGVAPLNQAGWNNKMFVKADLMPHQIKITGVRVERLQDISNADCLKEGIREHITHAKVVYQHDGTAGFNFFTPRFAFESLIDKVSGKGTWKSNPFVWVYEFELVKQKAQ